MTAAQLKEHTALQPKRREQRPAERLAAVPDGDPWQDQPAGELGRPIDKDAPGTIGPGQLRRLQAAYGTMGRDERLGAVGAVVGRELGSFKDLSFNEASDVLAGLEGAAR